MYSEVASLGKSHPTKTLASHKKLPPTKKLVSREKIPPTKNSLMLGQSSHRLITLVACLHPCFLLPVFLSSDGGLDAGQICSNALAPAGVPLLSSHTSGHTSLTFIKQQLLETLLSNVFFLSEPDMLQFIAMHCCGLTLLRAT